MKKIRRYIVVDDDATNNMICEFTIKRFDEGADVKSFKKPEEALTAIEKEYNNPAGEIHTILFLDVNMPTMTGWEFLDAFQQFHAPVREQFSIYILSSSIEDFKEEAEAYPIINGFLSKPLKIELLEKLMDLQPSSTK